MRGNSGFLRWLPSVTRTSALFGRHTTVLMVVAALALLAPSSTYAGPVSARHRRMMREVYTGFEANNQTEIQPEAGTCILNGLQVPESTANCEKKPGCRVIQKTGYCCPDYQCECERDGKTYSNGEKLVDPNTPCTVCYCQGGEITCSNVTCYERSDCEPKYIPGRCCPVYDNCPPLERKPGMSKETSTELSQPSSTLTSPSADSVSSSAPPTVKPEAPNNNPLGIKIKEITKPEEIRIIDEKPKQIYPITKPGESNGGSQVKASSSKEVQNGNSVEVSNQPQVVPPAVIVSSSESKTGKDSASSETANKLETADVNTINDEDSQKTVRHTSALASKDESIESSEESSGDDKKPAASQLGKEVVIVDHNGNSKPITVFGIEGLQRGDVQNDMGYENNTSSEKDDDKTNVPDLEIAASSSDSVKVLPLEPNPGVAGVSTTEGIPDDGKVIFDTVLYTAGPNSPEVSEPLEENLNLTEVVFDTVLHESAEGTGPISISTEGPKTHELHPHVEDYGTTSERNPAYPSIDDDLSNYGREEISQQPEDYPEGSHKVKPALQADEPRVPGSVAATTEGIGKISATPQVELKEHSTTEGINSANISDIFTDPIKGKESAPGELLLIPDWEKNSTDSLSDGSGVPNWPDEEIGSGSGLGHNLSNIYEGDEISSGVAPDNLSLEVLSNEPHPQKESIAQPGAVIVSPEQNPFQESMQKAIESINDFRKGYMLVF